jgi:hypothetical protein
MTPIIRRASDIAIVLALTAAISFVIILSANSLVAKTTVAKSYAIWLGFITRPDIVVTTLLAILVTMGLAAYHRGWK